VSYAALAVRLAASGLIALLAISMLPPFWTYSSLAAGVATVLWAGVAASRERRRLPAPTDTRSPRVAIRRKRRSLERDAFGDRVRGNG
jgi:hypothetical protein